MGCYIHSVYRSLQIAYCSLLKSNFSKTVNSIISVSLIIILITYALSFNKVGFKNRNKPLKSLPAIGNVCDVFKFPVCVCISVFVVL